MRDEPEFRAGLELFNAGSFWHAHEEWETLWLRSAGDDRRFIQGLIQVAAALVHWERGNPRGLALNWAKARRNLHGLPSPYAGQELGSLARWMDELEAGTRDTAPTLMV
ncbi:MAG TPA: DUF309 domain-containing protein [Herpetosiphonaceae bacterium]